jgi:hypothetical protein
VCIFAYGQTGSGKTYTMMGDPANQGIIPRAIQQVFASSKRMEGQGWQFTMTASMLEIYNDEYRDLLPRKRSADVKKHQVGARPPPAATASLSAARHMLPCLGKGCANLPRTWDTHIFSHNSTTRKCLAVAAASGTWDETIISQQ